jgi:NADH:ubiquinone oxidoreductase subunit C
VEKNELSSVFSAKILERARFGKSDVPLFWVEQDSLVSLARSLRTDPEIAIDWLENLSVMQVDEILVVTWFLRSRTGRKRLVLRSTVVPANANEAADLPSLADVWPEASLMEREASEMFGIRFGGREIPRRILPQGFVGFPLRKSYVLEGRSGNA